MIILLLLCLLCGGGVTASGSSSSSSISNSTHNLNTTTTTIMFPMMTDTDHIINNVNNRYESDATVYMSNTITKKTMTTERSLSLNRIMTTATTHTNDRSVAAGSPNCPPPCPPDGIKEFGDLRTFISDIVVTQVQVQPIIIDICMESITFEETLVLSNMSLYIRCHESIISPKNDNYCTFEQDKSRHFIITETSNITFQNIKFQNGLSSISRGTTVIDGDDGKNGGSLYINGISTVQLINCAFLKNKAMINGGAISIMNQSTISSTSLSLIRTCNRINSCEDTTIQIDNSKNIFEENNASNGDGGVIYADDNSNIHFNDPKTDTKFLNNKAVMGGAIKAQYQCIIIIQNAFFGNNIASISGGAIKVENQCEIMIKNVTFYKNEASDSGGALYVYGIPTNSTQLTSVIFESNRAQEYGAAIAYEDGELIMNDVQLLDSQSDKVKGAISLSNTVIEMNNVRSGIQTLDSCDAHFWVSENTTRPWKSSCVNLPPPPTRQTRHKRRQMVETSRLLESKCVTTDRELRDAVAACDSRKLRKPCRVDVCTRRIRITRPASSRRTRSLGLDSNYAIDVSDKQITIGCLLPCPVTERCELDGGGLSRIFYGNNTNITIENMNLTNGYDANLGSAMKIEINSTVTLTNCLFFNNSAPKTGSAIFISQTEFNANKIETRNNTGNGTPIQGYSSNLTINNALLLGNVNSTNAGGGILVFGSKISLQNVEFDNTTLSKTRNINEDEKCDVIVALYSDDDGSTGECVQLTTKSSAWRSSLLSSLSSIPALDSVQECFNISAPTPSPQNPPTISSPLTPPKPSPPTPPKPSPPTTPSTPTSPIPSTPTTAAPVHQICFSGNNIVEVQDKGRILITQLMIGDFVKSSMTDQFTQVYGFGHLDHHSGGVFLQICFDQNCSNGIDDDTPSPILEISARHLVMVDRNHQQSYIPASDVVVGDVLSERIVTKIQAVTRQGVYAPLTQSGDIVVSGVVASNYVQLMDDKIMKWQQHTLGHAIFLPQRLFCTCYIKICQQERYINGYGYAAYIIVHGSAIVNQKVIFAMGTFFVFLCFTGWIVQRRLSRKEFTATLYA